MRIIQAQLVAALAVLTIVAPMTAMGDAGRFQFVFGSVEVVDKDGNVRAVKRGSRVEEGDTIRTANRASAQLKMVDGAALAVRSQTEIRIDNYSYNDEEKEDKSFFSLVRGALRSITGLIGKSKRDNVRVSTSTATIGIRGSDADIGHNSITGLSAVRTLSGGHSITSPDANGQPVTLHTNAGQIAVASPGQRPAFTRIFPSFAGNAVPRTGDAEGDTGSSSGGRDGQSGQGDGGTQGDGSQQADGSGDGSGQAGTGGDDTGTQSQVDGSGQSGGSSSSGLAGGRTRPGPGDTKRRLSVGRPLVSTATAAGSGLTSSTTTGALSLDNQVIQQAQTIQNAPANQPVVIPGFIAPSDFSLTAAAFINNSPQVGTSRGEPNNIRIVRPSGSLLPIGLLDPADGQGFAFAADQGSLLAFGSGSQTIEQFGSPGIAVANVNWGIWGPGFKIFEGGVEQNTLGNLHQIVAGSTTPISVLQSPLGGGFSFFWSGSSSATNEDGSLMTGTFFMEGTFANSSTLGSITTLNINASSSSSNHTGSNDWSLNLPLGPPATMQNFLQTHVDLQASCFSGTCLSSGPPGPGKASGAFVGPNADGVILGFSATAGLNPASKRVVGTAHGQREEPLP